MKKKRTTAAKQRKARGQRTGLGVYTARERQIYRYCGGCSKGPLVCKGCRSIDPMEIYERLMDFPGFDLEADLKRYSTEGIPDKVKLESFKRLREAAAHAFHVQLYDESNQQQPGLTRGEIVALLYDFGLWVDEIKKKQDSSPTIAPSTEPVSSGGASPISNTSASGSTETASSAETQAPLPSGSPLPSGPSCPIVSLAGLGTTAEMPIACAPSTAPHKVG